MKYCDDSIKVDRTDKQMYGAQSSKITAYTLTRHLSQPTQSLRFMTYLSQPIDKCTFRGTFASIQTKSSFHETFVSTLRKSSFYGTLVSAIGKVLRFNPHSSQPRQSVPFAVHWSHVLPLCVTSPLAPFISLTSIILVDLMGLPLLAPSFGLVCIFRGVAGVLSSPLAGRLGYLMVT